MPFFYRVLALLLLLLQLSSFAFAQGTKEDYRRMQRLGKRYANKVYRTNVRPNWLPDGEHLWYRVRTGADAYEFVLVDLQEQSRQAAFDHAAIAEQLSAATEEEVSKENLPFTSIAFNEDLSAVFFRHDGYDWKFDRQQSLLTEAEDDEAIDLDNQSSGPLRPSVDRGGEVNVEFINKSSGPVRIIWIDRSGGRVPYQTITSGKSVKQHTFVGHVWLIVNAQGQPLDIYEASEEAPRLTIDGKRRVKLPRSRRRRGFRPRQLPEPASPDGKWFAFVRDHQLSIFDLELGEEHLLTEDADVNSFFTDRRFYWSPDSKYLVALQVDLGDQRKIHMVESSPKDELQPKLHTMDYVKPGDKIRSETPRLFEIASKSEVELNDTLFENPWSLQNFAWNDDSSEFTFMFNQRGHQALRLIGIDPTSGSARAIVDEQSDTFIDYTRKVYSHHLKETSELVWMSERDGWNHLYLYDTETGQVKNQITKGQWVVRSVERVDAKHRQLWFTAGGIVPGQDPYYIHHCRVDLDGSNLVVLTEGDGAHKVFYSPNKKYLVDTYSRVDLPPVTTVRRASDGTLVCQLEEGDHSALLEAGWQSTIRFSAKGRDGKTDIYGIIYLPSNFDPQQKYPVIENIYAGPHGSHVPKEFSANDRNRALAELGFIVVRIDGMGTSNRSKAFHDVCFKNIGDAGFPDRILWMQSAAEQYPQMDLSRVGIFGGSAGGQNALRALLAHGDFYKVAVADCGCHDNRMDKIWWNEQWMGYPIGPHYEEQSNVTQAHKLTGKLFLIVGELDRNVDPASTMQVVDALVKADKDFDLLVVPGGGHGVGSKSYGLRRTRDFFVRHLHGFEPRHDGSISADN